MDKVKPKSKKLGRPEAEFDLSSKAMVKYAKNWIMEAMSEDKQA